jgi:hypothetical protein
MCPSQRLATFSNLDSLTAIDVRIASVGLSENVASSREWTQDNSRMWAQTFSSALQQPRMASL